MGAEVQSAEFLIATQKSAEELERALAAYAPWRISVKFSNGFDTGRLETMQPWSEFPLQKLKTIIDDLGEDLFRGARILDVGVNAGYNAITLAQRYGAHVVGIDTDRRNLAKADMLAQMAGIRLELEFEDATHFTAAPFDIVLHLGTLYHLQAPLRALRTAALNTKPAGHLLLETAGYEGQDPLDARLIFKMNGDISNVWAIGLGALELMLDDAGFEDIRLLKRSVPEIYEGTGLVRLLIHARRKTDSAIPDWYAAWNMGR